MDCRGAIHGRNLFRQVGAKVTFSFAFLLKGVFFFCSNYAFLPDDYSCLFRRVGRYDGAFGF